MAHGTYKRFVAGNVYKSRKYETVAIRDRSGIWHLWSPENYETLTDKDFRKELKADPNAWFLSVP